MHFATKSNIHYNQKHRARKKNFKKQGNLLLACSTRLQRCKSPLSKSSAKWVALVILVKSPGNMKVVEWQYSPFDLLGCVKLPFWYGHCSWNHHKQNATFKWRWLPQKIIANNSFLKFEALFKHHMLWATCTIASQKDFGGVLVKSNMAFLPSTAVPLFIGGTRLLAGRTPSVSFQTLIFVWRENNTL